MSKIAEDKRISLHDWVWVRFNGEVDDEDENDQPSSKNEEEPSQLSES